MKCRICNSPKGKTIVLSEMMFKTYETFYYFECDYCNCLQILQIPDDISKFYSTNYYSLSNNYINYKSTIKEKIFNIGFKQYLKYCFHKKSIVGFFVKPLFSNAYTWMTSDIKSLESKILDIGTGTGSLLFRMRKFGFTNLQGIDPYIEKDIYVENISILKKSINEINETYDIVMMHHSIEHIVDPYDQLIKINRILKEEGIAIITTPIHNNFVWRKYGKYWVQLDAPRHINIFTVRGMKILSEKAGLMIHKVIFNSTSFQFIGSEKFSINLQLDEMLPNEKIMRKFFTKKAKELNNLNDGDSACFILKKIL